MEQISGIAVSYAESFRGYGAFFSLSYRDFPSDSLYDQSSTLCGKHRPVAWDVSVKTKLTVRNCPVDFRFQCSKLWDDLAVTTDAAIRHCEQCGSDVFFRTTDEETIAHARAGHCIAREVPDQSEFPRVVVIGQPSRPAEYTPEQQKAWKWNARESGDCSKESGLAAVPQRAESGRKTRS
jgi:hypothetical protein